MVMVSFASIICPGCYHVRYLGSFMMSPLHAICNSGDVRTLSGSGPGAAPDVAEVNSAPVDIEVHRDP